MIKKKKLINKNNNKILKINKIKVKMKNIS